MSARPDADALDAIFFPSGVPSQVVRERRRERRTALPQPEGPRWDRNAKRILHNGVSKEFFRTAALATALGKSVKTIYAWEARGIIPKARFRTATKRTSLEGKAEAGDRLYTRYQIEATVSAAEQCGIVNGRSPDWVKFTALVREAWAK